MNTILRQSGRRIILLVAVLFSFFSQVQCEAGIIGHWTFDEGSGTTATDLVGHHDGTITGASYIAGRVGTGALHFSGTNSYVLVGGIGSELQLVDTPYTLSTWVRWSGNSAVVQVIYAMDDGADYSGGYNLYIQVDGSTPSLRSNHNDGSAETWFGTAPPVSVWKQILITWDGKVRTFYVDGQSVGTFNTPRALKSDGNDPLVFGGVNVSGSTVSSLFRGDLDDMRIYNVAFTADQANQLFLGQGVTFHKQPLSQSIQGGDSATLNVDASANYGSDILQYQWQANGSDIAGATSKTYVTPPAEVGKTNQYVVVVRHDGGVFTSGAATIVGTPQPGLIGHWDFEETSGAAVNDSVFGQNGLIFNATRIPGISGSGALHFNGTNAYVFVGGMNTLLELTNTAYSVAWWQRWNGATGKLQAIIAKDNGADHAGGYQFYIESDSQLTLEQNSGANQDWFTGKHPDTNWQHFCVTWDLTNRNLFINGSLSQTLPTTAAIATRGNDPLLFGAINAPCCGGIINYFNGDLDDVRIYNVAISAADIQAFLPPPQITIVQQPISLTIGVGSSATFKPTVTVSGGSTANVQYQWKLEGSAIPNATNVTYTTPVKTATGLEHYVLEISGGTNLLTTDVATLQIVQQSGAASLIASWNFEEGAGSLAHDSVSTNHGSIVGAQFVPGRVGAWALDFNGTNSTVLFPSVNLDLALIGTPYTIAWWQKSRQKAGAVGKVISMDDGSDQLGGYSVGFNGSTFQAVHGTQTNQNWTVSFLANTNWTHYALVWNGVSRQLYVNGKLSTSTPTRGDVVSDNNDVLAFGSTAGKTNFFAGSLDDVRIYDYALAGSEVSALIVFPVLYIQTEPTGLRISWYVFGTDVYRVENTTALGEVAWAPISSTPTTEGEMLAIHIPTPTTTTFFRLKNLH